MGTTSDRNDPDLQKREADGQNAKYLILSEEERRKGFIRPVRESYRHLACRSITSMSQEIAETYARDPKFYGSTYCIRCGRHFPLIATDGRWAFTWAADGSPVGE